MNKYNLLNLLSETIVIKTLDKDKEYAFDGIQIPMIQRDYAHGRDGAREIRKRFLNSIFDALEKNNPLELDFIYGSIKQLDSKSYFIPLDGQQRLTTLFLFYWYIGNKELQVAEDKLELKNKLINFTYATRATAREFCNKLCEIEISLNVLPSKEIKNSSWFFEIYEKDPTVKSMLVVLDDIHEKYKLTKGNLYSNLSNLKFYILPLDGFALSDELYIKMNARGKQLTDFENFKADLINWLKDEKNPSTASYREKIHFANQEMPYYLAYAMKLDTNWTNLFWELCVEDLSKLEDENNNEDKAIIDPYFTRFWNRYLLNAFIVKSDDSYDNIEKSDFFSKFFGKEGDASLMSYENFDLHQSIFQQQNVIIESEKVLDALYKNYNNIKGVISPSWNKEDNWSLFGNEINQRQRILFFAINIYLEQNDFDINRFRNWIRVVWNIIIDPDIRSIGAMINVMRLIHQLSIGSKNIYEFLNKNEALLIIENSNFQPQLKEERLKAKLILSDNNWEKEILEAESHPMYMGNIGFLLNDNIQISKFRSKFKIAKNLFNGKGSNNEDFKEHLIMRSLLSKIKNWSTLQGFDFEDSHFNWQFLLRKKDWVGKIIDDFCSYETVEELQDHLKELVNLESNIESWSDESEALIRAKNAHNSIYTDGKFHSWLQHPDHRAVNLKWWGPHFYVHRPRSWYDWIMIDIKRNELISKLIEEYQFSADSRCDETEYFHGFDIKLTRDLNGLNLVMVLHSNGSLLVGFQNSIDEIPDIFPIIDTNNDNSIQYFHEKSYSHVFTEEEAKKFIKDLDNEIFDLKNSNSVASKLTVNV